MCRLRKWISLLLLAVFLIGALCPTEALAKTPDDFSINANRYYYRYETSSRTCVRVTKISARDVATTTNIKTIVNAIVGIFPYGAAASLTCSLMDMLMEMNAAGTLYTYKTVRKKIQVSALTGKENVVDTWHIIEFVLHDTYGNYYDARTHTIRIK